MNFWRMAFRIGSQGPEMWPECYRRGIAAIGYYINGEPVVGDCSSLTENEYNEIWRRECPKNTTGRSSLGNLAYRMKLGDIIYAKQGPRIVGGGRIISEYQYDPNILEGADARWEHFVQVEWDPDFEPIDILLGAEPTTVLRLSGDRLQRLQAAITARQSAESDDTAPTAQHHLYYWRPSTVDHNLGRGAMDHIAGNQLSPAQIHVGDTIWVVTVRQGILFLVGKLIVGRIIEGQDVARRFLGTTDLWEARFHVVAQPGTEEPLLSMNIMDIAPLLRFQSPVADRLAVLDGQVNPQQLQSVRKLTQESASVLHSKWAHIEHITPKLVTQATLEAESSNAETAFLQLPRGRAQRQEAAALDTRESVTVQEVFEGKRYRAEVTFRRRNRSLVEAKRANSDGRCEACGFCFEDRYGSIAADCLVAHHINPIARRRGPSKTSLNDIALLCPNCHAVVHTQDPPIPLEALRQMLRKQGTESDN